MTQSIYIKVKDVKKKLGINQALDGVSLDFKASKMHGVIGPEGAGKTTLLRLILGLLKPNQGEIEFIQENRKLTLKEIRNKVSYMPQQQSLYPDLSIEEHLIFFKDLYQIKTKEFQERRKELLEITRLKEFVNRPAGQLSGGMYKKLGLMCALLRSPEVMLLDEPTNGVDPISRREFWDLLYRLLDQKILIIVTTAYMDEAERCSEVHLLESGKVFAQGAPHDILAKEGISSFEEFFLKYDSLKQETKRHEK